jgi:hypothetical protein
MSILEFLEEEREIAKSDGCLIAAEKFQEVIDYIIDQGNKIDELNSIISTNSFGWSNDE